MVERVWAYLQHLLRLAVYRIGEFVHVCAIYLGISVLVTVVLAISIPSLQSQSRQLREAFLSVLLPSAYDTDAFALFGQGADTSDTGPTESTRPGSTPVLTLPQPQGDDKDASRRFNNQQTDFARAIQVFEQGSLAPGLSAAESRALRSYLARKYRIAENAAGALVNTVFVVARDRGLDPQLVLAVIAIESRYNPLAESHVGAQGLMQVMTSVHKAKFEVFPDGSTAAVNPIANIWIGTQILRNCIERRGSVRAGLACYVGATGPGDGGYGNKVLAELRRIALESGIPLAKSIPK